MRKAAIMTVAAPMARAEAPPAMHFSSAFLMVAAQVAFFSASAAGHPTSNLA